MGKPGREGTGAEGRWFAPPDVVQLRLAAEAWRENAWKNGPSNRLFLDLFAVYLVKHFRAEELRLEGLKAEGLVWHRGEHRGLVRQIWELMGDEQLGLEVTDGIHRLLEAWELHQVSASLRRQAEPSKGH